MGRGPSYPYVNLNEAIELTRKVYTFARKSPAPLASVVQEAWNYSATSSSGEKVLAALKAFGLLEESASGEAKAVKISERAYRILVDEQESPERIKALRDAALSPKWYRFCWETWGKEMPPSMRSNLLFEHGFVESTVDKFLEDYKATIQFARIMDGQGNVISVTESKPEDRPSLAIGDLVQWESQGVLQLPEPKKVREFSEDGKWAFVEGSNTGLPVKELIVTTESQSTSAPGTGLQPPRPRTLVETRNERTPPAAGEKQETFVLSDGVVVVQWPSAMSAEDFQDIADWLPILERKIKRSVQPVDSKVGAVDPMNLTDSAKS